MALIINLEEKKALVLDMDIYTIYNDLYEDGNVGTLEDGQEFIMRETFFKVLMGLRCSILPEPNYKTGGTKITFGGPKEIVVAKRRNKNLPHLNSSSGL